MSALPQLLVGCLHFIVDIIIVIACVNELRFMIIVIQLNIRPVRYRTVRPSVSPLQVPTLFILFTIHAHFFPLVAFLFFSFLFFSFPFQFPKL